LNVTKEIRNMLGDAFALLHGNFLVVALGLSLWSAIFGVFSEYEGKYIQALGGTFIDIGAFYGILGLITATAGIAGGYICDTYGRRRMIIIGNYTTAILWFIVALAPAWESYFATRCLLALASLWTVAEQLILIDTLPIGKRGLGLAIFWALPDLVGLVSPYIGGLIFGGYGVFGMKLVLLSTAIADSVKATVYRRFLKETLEGSAESKHVAFSIKGLGSFTAHSLVETFRTWKWMNRSLRALCALTIIYAFISYLTAPWFIFYATDVVHLTIVEWGAICSIGVGISLVLRLLGGRLIDRFGKRISIIVNGGIGAPVMLGFIYCRSYIQVLSVVVLSTAVGALSWAARQALQTDLTPKDKRGKVFSLFRILGAFSGFFGYILGGYAYTLSPALPFWASFILGITGTVFAFLITKKVEKPEE
jgi:MFS family permease